MALAVVEARRREGSLKAAKYAVVSAWGLSFETAELQLIPEALGHANIGTTVMYAHLTTSKRRQDLARLLEGPGDADQARK